MPTTPFAQSRGRVLHDSAGDEVGTTGNPIKASIASGSGGVTEYTEDAAAAANPVGGALILVRRDTLTAAEVTTDGDNVAAKATSKGEIYTKDSDLAAALGTEDAASAANPIGPMLMARRRDVPIVTEVSAEGDNIAVNADSKGQLRVVGTEPFPLPTTPWRYAAAASGIVNTTTAVTAKAADGSLCNYVSAMQIMWEALTTATEIAIRDGAAGTVLWRAKIPASLAGAREIVFPVPLKGTAATLLEVVTLTASGAGAVYWDLQGFVAA